MNKFSKILAYIGWFPNTIQFHGMHYNGIKSFKALQQFYKNKNTEIEMFLLIEGLDFKSMIDCGAYIGYFSIYSDKIKNNSNVVAFEADKDNFKCLKYFVELNSSKVKTYNKAIGGKTRKVDFFKPIYKNISKYPAHGQIGNPKLEDSNPYKDRKFKKYSVEMISLTEVMKEFALDKTLLKLDIEGQEKEALQSIYKELNERSDLDLIIELMINDSDSLDIFNLMRSCGYDSYLITNAGLVAEKDFPLILPKPDESPKYKKLRTLWRNHFFTKRKISEIKKLNHLKFGYNI